MIGDSSSGAHGTGTRPVRSAGERTSGEIRDVAATSRLAQADRQATAVLTPLLDIPQAHRVWVAAAFLLGHRPRRARRPGRRRARLAAGLDLAGPDQALFSFLSHPPPGQPTAKIGIPAPTQT